MITVKDFTTQHHACQTGIDWCHDKGYTTMQEVWVDPELPHEYRLWVFDRSSASDSTKRLFACWCVRQVWDLLTDDRSKVAVEVAERFARGEATQDDLTQASDAARAAASDAARAAASDAASDAAWAAASDAARAAASDAARAAASDAASDAAWAAASDAAWAAARAAQCEQLLETAPDLFKP